MRIAAFAMAAGLLLSSFAPPVGADESRIDDLLHRAAHREHIEGNAEEALRLYEQVLSFETVPPEKRGTALRALARIHETAGRIAQAEVYWKRIRADEELDNRLRDWAKNQQDKHRKPDTAGASRAEQERELRERMQAESRRLIKTALNAARAALDAGRFEEARRKAQEALARDSKNAEANEILAKVEALAPDRDDMWRQLLALVESQDLVEYDRIREEVQRRSRAARVAFDKKDWKEADRQYRGAIRLIDESGFLGFGGSVDPHSLDELRTGLIVWLRQTHDRGRAEGLSFEPEPPLPDLEARQGSLRARTLALFADVMRPPRAGAERIHFFEFRPDLKPDHEAKRSLSHTPMGGIEAQDAEGTLSRARWAERWIRRHIGTGWRDPRALNPAGKTSRRSRLLVRLGDHIAAECGEREQRRITKLQGDFVPVPPAMRVDVHLFAVSAAGAVGSTDVLRVSVPPRERGLDHVIHGSLLATCVRDLEGVPMVKHLGGAKLSLDGLTSRLLSFTQLTAQHPAYQSFPSKPDTVTVHAGDARYGLWLDLYVEDMEGRRGGPNKTPTSALSVVATVKQPDASVPSHIVPLKQSAEMPYTRLPVFTERTIEADRAVPHFGAFLLQGLPNPFPASRETHPELLVLIGTTRQDTPTPDPPRTTNGNGPIVPSDVLVRDYPVGALSIEVEDEIVPESWPELRTVREGMAAADRQRLRDRNLADVLMQLAGIDVEGPGGRDAIVVQDHRATGTLGESGHVRLQQGLQRLAAHENDLYQVRVRSGVVDAKRWASWVARGGFDRNPRGNYTISPGAREQLEAEFAELADGKRLFHVTRDRLARATQQLAFADLRPHAITKDYKVRRLTGDRMRYTEVAGTAEEGLVVEVRPMLERPDGTRFVRVRARAAKLRAIEQSRYPGANRPEVVYDVPRWHAGNQRSYSDVRDSELLTDTGALLIPLPLPGSESDRIVVFVTVRKVQ